MKNITLIILSLLFICVSCNGTDEKITSIVEKNDPYYIETLDFSSSVKNVSLIQDFDIENGNIYFIYDKSIYRIDLNSEAKEVELIIEDTTDWPNTLKVIGNALYYQGGPWAVSTDIKQIDLNAITEGVQSTHAIIGVSRSEFCKNLDKLYYISSVDGFSPINNFYEFNKSFKDQLIVSDEYIIPQNMRVVNNYLYFSYKKEIRKFNLNTPTEKSSIVYMVSDTEKVNGVENDIIGFDIKDNVVYYTQTLNNKLFAKNLELPNEEPIVLRTNKSKEGETGYGKLIISDGRLYVERVSDKQLDVLKI